MVLRVTFYNLVSEALNGLRRLDNVCDSEEPGTNARRPEASTDTELDESTSVDSIALVSFTACG